MNDWDDLLLTGGFAPRERILQGLTLAQVSARPNGVPHSIYQELWHAAMAQHITLEEGRAALERWPYTQHFPESPSPADRREWDELVALYLTDARQLVEQARDERWLGTPEPEYAGSHWRDALEFLAVHTAYHLGKVVCLRQVMGIWPG